MPRDTYDTDFLERVKDHPGRPADTARLIRLWRTFPDQWAGADPDGEACAQLENLHADATGLIKAEAEVRHLDPGPPVLWADMTRPEFIQSVMARAVKVFKSLKDLTWMECAEDMWGPPEQRQAVRHVVALVKRLEEVVRKETRRDNRAGKTGAPASETRQGGGADPHLTISDDAKMSVAELSKAFGVPAEPLRKRLERLRRRDFTCFAEVPEPARKQPTFLYHVGKVRPVIEALKASVKASAEASAKRPT